jgi:DNA-binding response OmpR family regulator
MANIAIIDDSELALELTKMLLDLAGHTVQATGDYKQFKTWVEGDPSPDLLIIDAIMPEIDGVELIKQIRTNTDPKIANLPVILASALDDIEASELGVLLLVKPFGVEELNSAISFALD